VGVFVFHTCHSCNSGPARIFLLLENNWPRQFEANIQILHFSYREKGIDIGKNVRIFQIDSCTWILS